MLAFSLLWLPLVLIDDVEVDGFNGEVLGTYDALLPTIGAVTAGPSRGDVVSRQGLRSSNGH